MTMVLTGSDLTIEQLVRIARHAEPVAVARPPWSASAPAGAWSKTSCRLAKSCTVPTPAGDTAQPIFERPGGVGALVLQI
jgi:hypothetical protein